MFEDYSIVMNTLTAYIKAKNEQYSDSDNEATNIQKCKVLDTQELLDFLVPDAEDMDPDFLAKSREKCLKK